MIDNSQFDNPEDELDYSVPEDGSFSSDLDLDALLADLNLAPSADEPDDIPLDAPVPEAPRKAERKAKKPEKPAKPPRQEPEEVPQSGGFLNGVARHHRGINIFLMLIAIVLVGCIAGVIMMQTNSDPYDGRIIDNVYVAGVNVGGMTKAEAVSAVEAAIGNSYATTDMTIVLGKKVVTVSAAQMHANLKVSDAVNAAYEYGRSGSSAERQGDFLAAQNTPKHIDLTAFLGLDTAYLRRTVEEYLNRITGEYMPSGYTLTGKRPALDADGFSDSVPCQELVLTVGFPGSGSDVDAICNAVLEGYSQKNFRVVVPPEYLAQFPEELDIDAIYAELHVDPVEAIEKSSGDGVPGSCGYTFSLDDARAQLSTAEYGDVITIPMSYIMPQKLDVNGSFTETISTYSTTLSGDEAYIKNVQLLCKSLDGYILNPGEAFSFFNATQKRTADNGYQMASCHPGYCLDEEIGGGADQFASTLYVAAMCADMKIVEKHNANHICPYTILGTELTVAQGWMDLKFSNPLKNPVLIRAKVSGDQLIIRILSEKAVDFYIKAEPEATYVSPHGTAFVGRKASDGFTDKQILIEGIDGAQVRLHFVKYSKADDKEISRTTEYVQVSPVNTTQVNIYG